MTDARLAVTLVLLLAAVLGCGDGNDDRSATPTVPPLPTLPTLVYPPRTPLGTCVNLQYTPVTCIPLPGITIIPTIVINTRPPTPTRIPIEITSATPPKLCYEISGSPCATETPTPQPTCVPTLGAPSCCSAHCEPCPTIRAGCNAQGCQDCVERTVCDPIPTCGPSGPIRVPPDRSSRGARPPWAPYAPTRLASSSPSDLRSVGWRS